MEPESKTEQGRRTALIIAVVVVVLLVAAVVCGLVVVAASGGIAYLTLAGPVPTEGSVAMPPTQAATVTPEVLIEVGPTPTALPEPTVEVEPTSIDAKPVDQVIVLDIYDIDIGEDSYFDTAEVYWTDFGVDVSDEPLCQDRHVVVDAPFYEMEVHFEFDLGTGDVTGYISGAAEVMRDDCGHSLDSGLVYIWGDFTGRVEPVGDRWEFYGEDGSVEVLFDQVRINCPAECNPGTGGPTTDIFAEVSEGVTLPLDFEGYVDSRYHDGFLIIWAEDEGSFRSLQVIHNTDEANPLPWGDWPPVP